MPVRHWATRQAMAAGADIVETNQVMQAVASGKPVCDGTKCVPLRAALKKSQSSLLPPRARSVLAHTRLASAKTLLGAVDVADKGWLGEALKKAEQSRQNVDLREVREGVEAAAAELAEETASRLASAVARLEDLKQDGKLPVTDEVFAAVAEMKAAKTAAFAAFEAGPPRGRARAAVRWALLAIGILSRSL